MQRTRADTTQPCLLPNLYLIISHCLETGILQRAKKEKRKKETEQKKHHGENANKKNVLNVYKRTSTKINDTPSRQLL